MRGRTIKKLLVLLLVPVVMMTGCNATENKQEVTENIGEEQAEKVAEEKAGEEPETEIQTQTPDAEPKNQSKSKTSKKFSENQNFQTLKSGAYSEDGFYTYDEEAANIYFIDKNTNNAHVLCSNIGCNHSTIQCSAYFVDCSGVYYTGDYLYVLAGDKTGTYVCLYRFKPDGSEKEEVAKLFSTEEEDMAMGLEFIIHKGYGYMSINWLDVESKKEREQVLYRVSLEDGSKEEIYEIYGYCPQIKIRNTDGDNIYIYTYTYKDANLNEFEEKDYVYNITDGSVTPIEVEGNMIHRVADGDEIYILKNERKLSKYLNYYETEFEIHKMKKNGKDSECIYAMSQEDLDKKIEIMLINIDEKYIYLIGSINAKKDFLKIISLDGKQTYTYEEDSLPKCLWSDGKVLLMQNMRTRDYILHDIKTGEDTVVKK